jgi:hypothetical protein
MTIYYNYTYSLHRSIRIPPLGQSGDMCLKFAYHMWGFHMGSLEVIIIRNQQNVGIWSSRGNQGNTWREAIVLLQNMQPFDQVSVLKGTRSVYVSSGKSC